MGQSRGCLSENASAAKGGSANRQATDSTFLNCFSSIRFGGQIRVVMSIAPAITNALGPYRRPNVLMVSGSLNSLGHHLQGETPGGAWFSRVSCGKQRVITGP